jgi:hypothetical protein
MPFRMMGSARAGELLYLGKKVSEIKKVLLTDTVPVFHLGLSSRVIFIVVLYSVFKGCPPVSLLGFSFRIS